MKDLNLIDYSEKCFVITGETKQFKNELKALGGRFNPRLTCGPGWVFVANKRAAVESFLNDGNLPTCKEVEKSNDSQLLAEYINEMQKVWAKDSKMIDYFKKEFSTAIKLSNGGLMIFEKPKIETSFCFGYSHDDDSYKSANEMAHYASTNEKYFISENLRSFDEKIKQLKTLKGSFDSPAYPYLHRVVYSRANEKINIFRYFVSNYSKDTFKEIKDSEGIFETVFVNVYDCGRYYDLQEINESDLKSIIKVLEQEREKFLKRLQAYLKRYGTSKLRTWSYWQDE